MARQFHYRDDRLCCEDVPVQDLVAAHGTPLYVYSEAALLERYRQIEDAFSGIEHLIAFSVKANGNVSILRLLARAGAGADIVSGGELHRARVAGVPPERIVFSGVGKTVVELATALEAGIHCFNVESEGELRALSNLATTMRVAAPVSLRVNPDIESPTPHAYTRTGHLETKFGIPAQDALRLYRLAAGLPGVRVIGLDVHIGSQILDVAPYTLALQAALELVDQLHAEGIRLEHIDVGGGFGIAYDGEEGPDAQAFASGIVPHLRGRGLKLIVEPGRFIAGPAGVLLTRVLYVKTMGSKTFVITDAGMNDLLRPSHYASYHRVEPAERHAGREIERYDIVGPICETGDFLALDRPLPEPREGELLCIRTTGAYGFSMASTYNARPRPAEVLVSGAAHRLIRRRETVEDLVSAEIDLLEPEAGSQKPEAE